MTNEPILSVTELTMRFGGLLAVAVFLVWYPDVREPELLMEHS